MLVALRLQPASDEPSLDTLADALDRPERPLFIGRKPFLPSARLFAGFVDADTVRAALLAACRLSSETGRRAQWPTREGGHGRQVELTDGRNWRTGVHAGLSDVIEGELEVSG